MSFFLSVWAEVYYTGLQARSIATFKWRIFNNAGRIRVHPRGTEIIVFVVSGIGNALCVKKKQRK
jgi:hypothetical protein